VGVDLQNNGVCINPTQSLSSCPGGLGKFKNSDPAADVCIDPSISACPYNNLTVPGDTKTLGCNYAVSDWLGYGGGSMQLKIDPKTGQPMNPWSVDWYDYSGVHHTEPLDVNCRCFDPTKTVALNPDAWASVPSGVYAADQSAIRYFRGIRNPTENANIARNFRIKEKMVLQIRVEFTNIFNRLQWPNPSTGGITTSFNTTKRADGSDTGVYSSGFGTFGNLSTFSNGTSPGIPRAGTFVARLTF
jgi:hypothetical protein